jgi:hypothetical protein
LSNRFVYILIVLLAGFFLFKAGPKSGIFYGDGLGYYAYLPATFIHGNLTHVQDISLDTTIDNDLRTTFTRLGDSYTTNEQGNVINQYTYGVAAMNAPFFLLSHLGAIITGYEPNGFTIPYLLGIRLAGLIYAIFGLLLLFKVLKYYYDSQHAIISIALLFLGTNLLWFTVVQAGMAHINAFFLFTLIIYASHKIYTTNEKKWIAICAFALGLLTIIRPTDLIALIIPITFGMTSIQNRINELSSKIKDVLTIGTISFVIPILPQLIYWKIMTGSYLFYSYDEQGFDWLQPHIVEGLIGANNGWFTYTPLVILPLIGLLVKKWSGPTFYTNVIIVPIYIYVTYAWWCYNYINGFGSRPMTHLYPLLAFPLTGILYNLGSLSKNFVLGFGILLSLVNINYTNKALNGTLFTDVSSHAFNFSTFFKSEIDKDDLVVRDVSIKQPELSSLKIVQSALIVDTLLIGDTLEYSPFTLKYKLESEDLKYTHLMVTGHFMAPQLEFSIYDYHMMVITVDRKGENVFWKSVGLNNKIGKEGNTENIEILSCNVNIWGDVNFCIPLDKFEMGDEVKTFIWNPNRKLMNVSQFKMSLGNN